MKKARLAMGMGRRDKVDYGTAESDVLVFCDKTTGATQFRSESGLDGAGSVERAAGLLAIQCLVRGHDPDNFVILVPAEASLSDRLLSRARELLREGREISCPVPLSPRQREILQSVVRSLSNKEIASQLNISVRTVKFHVSSLLEKFGVESRNALAQKASPMLGMQPPGYRDLANEDYGMEEPALPASAVRSETTMPTLRFPTKLMTA